MQCDQLALEKKNERRENKKGREERKVKEEREMKNGRKNEWNNKKRDRNWRNLLVANEPLAAGLFVLEIKDSYLLPSLPFSSLFSGMYQEWQPFKHYLYIYASCQYYNRDKNLLVMPNVDRKK